MKILTYEEFREKNGLPSPDAEAEARKLEASYQKHGEVCDRLEATIEATMALIEELRNKEG